MDALVAFGVNWKLLLIQVINFSLLIFILHRYLYKPLFIMLEKRQQMISKGIQDANDATREKEQIVSEKEGIIRSAREEGGKIVDSLHKQGIEEERKIIRDAQEKGLQLLDQAKLQAKAEHEQLIREGEKEIARMGVLAAEKVLRATPTSL